jgi:hypothetical protein
VKLRSILARFGLVVTAASVLGVSAIAQEAKVTEKKLKCRTSLGLK